MLDHIQIRRLESLDPAALAALSEVLIDCVDGGASVSFMHPLSRTRADNFWNGVAPGVAAGERLLLVALDPNGEIVGTVQVVLKQPENQPHRADVAKLLVHRKARRTGLGAALVTAAEHAAALAGKRLLVLDTVTGSPAEQLYKRLGWQVSGVIPDYALWPDGRLCATTVFYKRIGDGAAA
jgi:GNAT superfamily N-acetyltransferase